MSEQRAPDFSKNEIRVIQDTLQQRYDEMLDREVSLPRAQADDELKPRGDHGKWLSTNFIYLTSLVTGDFYDC